MNGGGGGNQRRGGLVHYRARRGVLILIFGGIYALQLSSATVSWCRDPPRDCAGWSSVDTPERHS